MNIKTAANRKAPLAVCGFDALQRGTTSVHLLLGERTTSVVTPQGTGYYAFEQQAVTRWRADPTGDSLGSFIYLREPGVAGFWSHGYQPTVVLPESYQVVQSPGRTTFARVDRGLEARMEICIAPHGDFEIRRCKITNHSDVARDIELTSYCELVLQDAEADQSHPAFSKLFVETFYDPSGTLLARRRPRQAGDNPIHACHYLLAEDSTLPDDWETNRRNFIGRGNSLTAPAALAQTGPLSCEVGSVLDPIFSLRKTLTLAPGETAQVCFVLGSAASHSTLLEQQQSLLTEGQIDEAFLNAEEATCELLARQGVDVSHYGQLNRIAFNRLYSLPDEHDPCDKEKSFQPSVNGHTDHSRSKPREDALGNLASFLAERSICSSRYVRSGLSTFGPQTLPKRSRPQLESSRPPSSSSASDSSELLFFNGIGGFSADGREYVIHLRTNAQGQLQYPPLPWHNVVSNEQVGFIVSETGAGYTWAGNSRLNRITPWYNEPVTDPHGEVCYVRDRQSGQYWSVTPGPIARATEYEIRHGWGYSNFTHTTDGLLHEVCVFVPRDDAVKITRIRLTNNGTASRKLDLYAYAQWDLSDGNRGNSSGAYTTLDREKSAVFAQNKTREIYADSTAFAALVGNSLSAETHLTADRSEFVGLHRDLNNPLALATNDELSGRCGADLDPCAAIQRSCEIAPGETLEFAFLLGETPTDTAALQAIEKFSHPQARAAALAEAQDFWRNLFSTVQIETPAKAIDLVVNGWLPYQNISCRLWGRSSSYQSGGAYGFRDQLQDSSALVHFNPQVTREQILRNAAHQFIEGDVMHWWHPPHSAGIRTNFADDLLWMPLIACEYVQTTGDDSLWQEQVRFLTSEPVPAGEPEIFLIPSDSGQKASLYEHCCRALRRGLTQGNNGLPLIGTGDWNDGMNRIGQAGKGESVWMGFFIDYVLERMIPVCEARGDTERVDYFTSYRSQLRDALNDAGWDGNWYRRAFFDDGTPVGSAASDECQIDGLVQAWAVMSGVAPPERAALATSAAEERLIDREAGLIRLLDPPFDNMKHDPGYIKGYLPGIRENGGQYTHGILWLIRAFAELGRGSLACELLEMISPVSHGCSPETAATYMAEPYVVAADVYSIAPHAGRAGWSWYTGSAGWFWRVAVESLLGIHLERNHELRIDPSIAADWPEFRVRYRLTDGKTTYEIHVQNPQCKGHGVSAATLDGTPLEKIGADGARVPVVCDGQTHQVTVVL